MNVRELIERYNAAWNAQDLAAIDELHHPDVVFHNHTAEERAEGAAAVREHIAQIFRNNPTLRFETRSLRAGDDFAVCEWTASTGSQEWDGVDVFPLREGKIARKDVYSSSHRPRRPAAVHDRGGRPTDAAIDRSEHELEDWEVLTDSLLGALSQRGVMNVDELRRGIESMPPAAYEAASYYERWLYSAETILTEKGVLEPGELDRRAAG
jgi:ketosteroid isomerase-like protein